MLGLQRRKVQSFGGGNAWRRPHPRLNSKLDLLGEAQRVVQIDPEAPYHRHHSLLRDQFEEIDRNPQGRPPTTSSSWLRCVAVECFRNGFESCITRHLSRALQDCLWFRRETRPLTAPSRSVVPGNTLGVILAGGASRRFGSDKSAAFLRGVSLSERVIDRARPQVDALAISGGAAHARDLPFIPDRIPGAGPLMAVYACLSWAAERGYPLVATFPCDAPFFPPDLVQRLRHALGAADGAMARRDGQGHYAFALWRVGATAILGPAIERGIRSFRDLEAIATCAYADFPVDGEGPHGDPFFNINWPDDLVAAEEWLSQTTKP